MRFETKTLDGRTSAFLGLELREHLIRWALEAAPREACGLLFSAVIEDEQCPQVAEPAQIRAVQVPNIVPGEAAQTRFELDPSAWVAAEAEARERGEVLVGIWHSHPDGPPRPSRLDAQGARALPGDCAYLLVDLSSLGSASELTVWKVT